VYCLALKHGIKLLTAGHEVREWSEVLVTILSIFLICACQFVNSSYSLRSSFS